jgi:hypothetical protein
MAGPLADVLFWIALGATVTAHAFILRSTLRGMRIAAATRPPFSEWVWAVLPALSLVVLFVWTWHAMHPDSISFQIPANRAAPGGFRQ